MVHEFWKIIFMFLIVSTPVGWSGPELLSVHLGLMKCAVIKIDTRSHIKFNSGALWHYILLYIFAETSGMGDDEDGEDCIGDDENCGSESSGDGEGGGEVYTYIFSLCTWDVWYVCIILSNALWNFKRYWGLKNSDTFQ